jgi:hypothetical protein
MKPLHDDNSLLFKLHPRTNDSLFSGKTGFQLLSSEAFILGTSLPYLLSLFQTSLEPGSGWCKLAYNLPQLGDPWFRPGVVWSWACSDLGDNKRSAFILAVWNEVSPEK